MILHTEKILRNPRVCKAVFGMSRKEIEAMLPLFGSCLVAHRHLLRPERKRKIGGGRKGDLPANLDKLLYILMYLKLYPTYDALSVLADHQRSKCGDSVKLFLPVLEKALGRSLVLPARGGNTLEEIFRRRPELRDVFLDGTERRIERPRNIKRRNKLYSGKKKGTTRKTIIMGDEKRNILFMSPTKSGRRHDKRLTDASGVIRAVPNDVAIWSDTGFKGMGRDHPNVVMPKKRTKLRPLTEEERCNNQVISGIRVIVEHAISGFKRFRAAGDVYRNRLPNFDDRMNCVCAGLWNFHLAQTA